MGKGWIVSTLSVAALLCTMGATAYGADDGLFPLDPILQGLQQISKEDRQVHVGDRNRTRNLSGQHPKRPGSKPTESNRTVTAELKSTKAAPTIETQRTPPSFKTDPHPVTYDPDAYLALKKIPLQPADPIDPQRYLSLKRIIEPLPDRYAQTYLKLKTLLNPTRTYVIVHIDKSRQRMRVYLDNDYVGGWKVSTARRGYWTPTGIYRPYTLERMHYSRKYHHSPMPWSVFFKGGFAIHGTHAVRHLGHPASHGCVRVHPRNARILYQLIRRYGMQNTRIIING